MSMTYNFYSVSESNMKLIKDCPAKLFLLLKDEEGYIDTIDDFFDGNVELKKDTVFTVIEREGKFVSIFAEGAFLNSLAIALKGYSQAASEAVFLLMRGGHATDFEIGWAPLRLISPSEILEAYESIKDLKANDILFDVDFEIVAKEAKLSKEFLDDKDKIIDSWSNTLNSLQLQFEFLVENEFGLTAELL